MSTTKIFFAVLLGAANMVAGAPLAEDHSAAITKRTNPTFSKSSNCMLDMYPILSQAAALSHMQWLRGDKGSPPEQSVYVRQGTTKMISCQGGAGVYLSVPADPSGANNDIGFENKALSEQIDAAYHDCFGGGPTGDEGANIWAWQTFQTGYDLLVHGSADCKNFSQD